MNWACELGLQKFFHNPWYTHTLTLLGGRQRWIVPWPSDRHFYSGPPGLALTALKITRYPTSRVNKRQIVPLPWRCLGKFLTANKRAKHEFFNCPPGAMPIITYGCITSYTSKKMKKTNGATLQTMRNSYTFFTRATLRKMSYNCVISLICRHDQKHWLLHSSLTGKICRIYRRVPS